MKKIREATNLSRNHWAAGIGRVIYSLNEVDFLLPHVYQLCAQNSSPIELPRDWLKLTMAKRIEKVESLLRTTHESPATLRVRRLFAKTKVLMETRNHIAHGTLVMAAGDKYDMVRYHKKSDQIISLTEVELIEATRAAKELSENFSLLVALAEMHEHFNRPYASGEPQGIEEIKPRDPAPLAEQ